jgi:hypothetical protein
MNECSLKAKVITFTCDVRLFEQIEEFCWANRIRSRNHAMRELMRAGLRSGIKPTPEELPSSKPLRRLHP